MMRRLLLGSLILVALSCKNRKHIPDVTNVKVHLTVERFETDFFALDTLHLDRGLQQLAVKHPGFAQDFLFNILGTTPDSAAKDVPFFIHSYQSLAAAAVKKFSNIAGIEREVSRGLQFVHYYFPSYQLPAKLITFIGPMNSYGTILTRDALAVGLQLYMGRDYPLYQSEQGQQLYPAFISRKFEPGYIAVNCMKNIIDDMYPDKSMGRPLIEQMVESGKRLYILHQLMPEAADSIKTGYTAKQLNDCRRNEQVIWSFFVQHNLLYNTDPNMTRDYMTDGPNTAALGEASPGNIGQFVGMQIVSRWMDKQKGLSLDALMKTPARQVFEEAKYKP